MKPLPRNTISPSNILLYKSLGSLIKDYRQWRNLSQETFAESIRISTRELQNWEAGRSRVRIDNLHDLSEFTGIPMQVCVALNADQPVWYSLRERRFAYSIKDAQFSPHELFRYRGQLEDKELIANHPITTDKHIRTILEGHHDVYGTERSLRKDVIKTVSMILPDFNFITFDSWGHYVGHQLCLPLRKDIYERMKKEKVFEDYLTSERLSDIITQKGGVFFYYSSFAASISVVYLLTITNLRCFAKIEEKDRYLVANYAGTIEAREYFTNLGMRKVRSAREDKAIQTETDTNLYETELDVLMRPFGPLAAMGWMIEEYDKKAGSENQTGEAGREELPVIAAQKPKTVSRPYKKYSAGRRAGYDPLQADDPLMTDKKFLLSNPVSKDKNKQGDQERVRTPQINRLLRMDPCPNQKCTAYGKPGKGNIVFNGTHLTKEGTPVRRFLCKECNTSFCSRSGSIFYGLRSPEDKVMAALNLLAEGMPLRGVAKKLGVKLDTVRHWLGIAAKQSGKIDARLVKELDISQADL